MTATSPDDLQSYLAVNLIRGVGPRLQTLLLERFETPARILKATSAELREIPGIGSKILEEWQSQRHEDMARRELAECEQLGVSLIIRGSETYPVLLQEIADPPLLLYQRGQVVPTDQLAVAIVGSRDCTVYGRRMAEQISAGLARAGITIISGLARGIDGVAHRAALQAGGRTIAVCASGLSKIYPPEHGSLAEEISRQGAVISESPLQREPTRGLFPQRNRIVSGMSLGVVVIEASSTSGTLHTARHAMEQGRDVFAVPGQLATKSSEGCHALIRDGARLIRGVDDILEDLGPLMQPVCIVKEKNGTREKNGTDSSDHGAPAPGELSVNEPERIEIRSPRELILSEQQAAILNLLHESPVPIDHVIEQSGLETSRVLSTLTILEMKRFIQRLPGNLLVRLPR